MPSHRLEPMEVEWHPLWWMDEWMDGWMDGWMNEWMDGWMNKQMQHDYSLNHQIQHQTFHSKKTITYSQLHASLRHAQFIIVTIFHEIWPIKELGNEFFHFWETSFWWCYSPCVCQIKEGAICMIKFASYVWIKWDGEEGRTEKQRSINRLISWRHWLRVLVRAKLLTMEWAMYIIRCVQINKIKQPTNYICNNWSSSTYSLQKLVPKWPNLLTSHSYPFQL